MTNRIYTIIAITVLITFISTGLLTREKYLYMNGRNNFEKFLREHPYSIKEKLTDKQWKKKLPKKTIMPENYQLYGNLVSTSIPKLMEEYLPKYPSHKLILLSGFGVGLSHTSILLSKGK